MTWLLAILKIAAWGATLLFVVVLGGASGYGTRSYSVALVRLLRRTAWTPVFACVLAMALGHGLLEGLWAAVIGWMLFVAAASLVAILGVAAQRGAGRQW